MKKAVAALTVLAMLLMLPFSAFAAASTDANSYFDAYKSRVKEFKYVKKATYSRLAACSAIAELQKKAVKLNTQYKAALKSKNKIAADTSKQALTKLRSQITQQKKACQTAAKQKSSAFDDDLRAVEKSKNDLYKYIKSYLAAKNKTFKSGGTVDAAWDKEKSDTIRKGLDDLHFKLDQMINDLKALK